MIILIIKFMLILFGITIWGIEDSVILPVVSFLIALVISMICQYLNSKRFTIVCVGLYLIACIFLPMLNSFIPLLCFELFMQGNYYVIILALVALLNNVSSYGFESTILILLHIINVLILRYLYGRFEGLIEENKCIRDNSREGNRVLEQKNKELMEKQDYEIHLAELNERNRIAREIHDNVGHMLTSSILQIGALQIINKDDVTAKRISEIKNTLSMAMDSIRGSVHNLKADSIDLYDVINKMCEPLAYSINVDYDIEMEMDVNIKYCIIAVMKEAVTNITKHSNATSIDIKVQEHPSMYQFLIHDNGTKEPSSREDGIGLMNIEERVKSLNGNFTYLFENGFRIFISIPKGGTI